MKKMPVLITAIALMAILITGCKKQEGKGGTSVITGKVMIYEYCCNQWGIASDTFPAQAKDVYIVYGDEAYFGDRIETHHDGTYQFEFLTRGKYTVYSYSDDTSVVAQPTEKMVVSKTIEINTRKQTATMPELVIYRENF